ncbi:hypothetical protein LBMAG42_41930 [Deltaproteobacteria bacterium]|nr:hypothetical protein LBMAG42_41930 [Deltaproteobacteria bacterium]
MRRTERLVLRPFQEADRAPFAAMNADPEVMEHLPTVLDRAESDALLNRYRLQAARRGFGVFAVEERATRAFIGWLGLWVPDWETEFTPAVEFTWRLVRPAWGQGYATEAARSTLAYAFDTLRLPQLMAWTTPANQRSWRVMERLGMTRVGTFAHPKLPAGHPMSEHVRYVIDAPVVATVEPATGSVQAVNPPAKATETPLPKVWIDGDGCPRVVKEIIWKAAHRGVVTVTMVANRAILVPRSPRIHTVVVPKGMDVADDWLVAHAGPNELVITSDVPLAAELVPRGVAVMSPRGEWFTPANIGEKLSLRDFFTDARASGMIEGGGPAGFDERAKREFANGLDGWIARAQPRASAANVNAHRG